MARKSTGEYPKNWPEISQAVKAAAGWKCVRCGHPHDVESGYMLTVHHLDLNKSNCAWWNLTSLCQRCHLEIQGKVIMEQDFMFEHSAWFRPYVAAYYAAVLGMESEVTGLGFLIEITDYEQSLLALSPEFVMEQIETLLPGGKKPVKKS